MTQKTSRAAIAASVAALVLFLSFFGALEGVPAPVRGLAQAMGTVAGIVLGAQLQLKDQKERAQGAAKTAALHLIALGKGLQVLLKSADDVRLRTRENPPKSIDAYQNGLEGFVSGVEGQVAGLLAQAEAAAGAWAPFLAEDEPLRRAIAAAERPVQGEEQAAGEGGP